MPKVKIVYTRFIENDNYSQEIIAAGVDWDDVTNEEFELLRWWVHRLNPYGDLRPRLIVQDPEPIADRIRTVREMVETAKRREEEEAEKKRKRQAAKKLQRESEKEQLLKRLKELGVDAPTS